MASGVTLMRLRLLVLALAMVASQSHANGVPEAGDSPVLKATAAPEAAAKPDPAVRYRLEPIDAGGLTAADLIATVAPQPGEEDSEDEPDVSRDLVPVSPAEVVETRVRAQEVERAKRLPLTVPEPVVRTIHLNVEPGAKPSVLRLTMGYDSTITILDVLGQPWPISKYSVGDKAAFEAAAVSANSITVKPTAPYGNTNLTLLLPGVDSPVSFSLSYSESKVDYQLTAILQRPGPNAQPQTVSADGTVLPAGTAQAVSLVPLAGSDMAAFLDQVPPSDAYAVPTYGDAQTVAWWYNGRLVLRTPWVLAYPSLPTRSVLRGAGAYSVYVIDQPMNVVTVLRDGRPLNVQIALEPHMLRSRKDG
jgi:hypothetical protein